MRGSSKMRAMMAVLRQGRLLRLFLLLLATSPVDPAMRETLYMDSMATCGQTHTIYDMELRIMAHMNVQNNAIPRCETTIVSGYTDTYYVLEIVQESVRIQDCAMKLNIFNGRGTAGIPLKSLSCGSKSTGILYSKGKIITLELRRPDNLFQPANDFNIIIRSFRDPNAPDVVEGVSHLPVGAIVGIVLGIVVFVAFCILLCWCYCSGKIPGFGPQMYRKPVVAGNKKTSGSINGAYSAQNTPSSSKKNMYVENDELWENLTDASKDGDAKSFVSTDAEGGRMFSNTVSNNQNGGGRIRGRRQTTTFKDSKESDMDMLASEFVKSGLQRSVPPAPPVGSLQNGPGRTNQNNVGSSNRNQNHYQDDKNTYENYPVTEAGAQGRRYRPARGARNGQDQEETDIKRPHSGIFDNPDKDGYIYDYDQVKTLSSEEKKKQDESNSATTPTTPGGGMVEELQRELNRRKSLKENGEGQKSKETEISEAPGGPPDKTAKTGTNGRLPEELGGVDSKYMAVDQQSEVADSEKISNPMLSSSNPAIRASVNELRPRGSDESPRSKKKKRRKNSKKSISGDTGPRKHKNAPGMEDESDMPEYPADETGPDSYPRYDDEPLSSLPLPPEALAPVFASDSSAMQHYYPQQPEQYGYQPQPQIIGYDAYGNAVYSYDNQAPGVPGGVPYGQPAQPTWYVQQTPEGAMIMTPSHPGVGGHMDMYNQGMPMGDISTPGAPGFSSTPSNYDPNLHTGRHQSPHHGRKSRSKSHNQPSGALSTIPGGPQPTGTVLDITNLPPPGSTMVTSGIDPATGANTNQLIWSDQNRDPTDPTGTNPQITRKTIVRLTTKDTDTGHLPDPPNPALHQMSFNTAQQLHSGVEPAFLSPSKSMNQPVQPQLYAPKAVYAAAETPERENAAFYTGMKAPATGQQVPGGPKVHQAPKKNQLIRDKIVMSRPDEDDL